LPAHIIRSVIGFREASEDNRFWICPNLPDSFTAKGKIYAVRGLNYLAGRLDLRFTVLDDRRLQVNGMWPAGNVASVTGSDRRPLAVGRSGRNWHFEANNHERYLVRISHPE